MTIEEALPYLKEHQQELTDRIYRGKYTPSPVMPWGINIYQAVSYDLQTENAQMLPSYIYYGVSNKEAVIVSKLGVPRFAVNNILKILKEKYSNVPISVEHIGKLKSIVLGIDATDYQVEDVSGKVIKEIINKRVNLM